MEGVMRKTNLVVLVICSLFYSTAHAATEDKVVISLDKKDYLANDIAIVTIKNNSESKIWLPNRNCGTTELQKLEEGEWLSVDMHPRRKINCPWKIDEVKSGEEIIYKKDLSYLISDRTLPVYSSGSYRFGFFFYNDNPSEKRGAIATYTSYSEIFNISGDK